MPAKKRISEEALIAAHQVHKNYYVPVTSIAAMMGMSYQGLQKKWARLGLEDMGFKSVKKAFTPVTPQEAKAYRFLYENLGMGTQSIAKVFGRATVTISTSLKAQGIEFRQGEYITLKIPIGGKQ